MSDFNEYVLLAELATEDIKCELNHGPDTDDVFYQAVSYIILPLGRKENNDTYKQEDELSIPVCKECAEALNENEWTLVYCVSCLSNQWIARQYSKMNYRHHILWLQGCPKCTNEFGGLYFSDGNNDER